VHLWWRRWDALESLDALRAWLSEDERRRSERFRRERDACAFASRRVFLRRILALRAGCRPEELVFTIGEFGKPSLAHPDTDLCFSASSSGGWALVAVAAGRELGADVERLDARLGAAEELSRLARRVLTSSEQAELERLAPRARPRAFLRAWTRKEALLKALGTGLAREPDTVEVGPFLPHSGARLFDLLAPHGLVASLVVQARAAERLLLRPRGL
jgi:4'-phosphopantetheinyl transferase